MTFTLERVSLDFGNCLSGISAEYSADGYDLLLGSVGIRHRQGNCSEKWFTRLEVLFSYSLTGMEFSHCKLHHEVQKRKKNVHE